MSVAEAAEYLGVGEQHVRRLVARGALEGRRLGGVWMVDSADVVRQSTAGRHRGRPLSAAMAWAVLSVLADGGVESLDRRLVDRKLRHNVRQRLANAPEPSRWPSWMSRRSVPRRFEGHRSVPRRLDDDADARRGGLPTASAVLGVPPGDELPGCWYVPADRLDDLIERHALRADPAGRFIVHVVDPKVIAPVALDEMMTTVALVDIADSADARVRDAAAVELRRRSAVVLDKAS